MPSRVSSGVIRRSTNKLQFALFRPGENGSQGYSNTTSWDEDDFFQNEGRLGRTQSMKGLIDGAEATL
jgi:hypothetical protein